MKKLARQTGLIYFISAVAAIYGYAYASSQITVAGDLASTCDNILANELLFRSGVVANVLKEILSLIVGLMLYRLFKEIDLPKARFMLSLVVVGVAVRLIAHGFNYTSLSLLKGSFLSAFESDESLQLVYLCRKFYASTLTLAGFFCGLWLLPFGQLVYKSGFIPKIFGILLIVGATGYVVENLNYLLPNSPNNTLNFIAGILYAPSESAIILWLMIKGVKEIKS